MSITQKEIADGSKTVVMSREHPLFERLVRSKATVQMVGAGCQCAVCQEWRIRNGDREEA